eukprot:scaffold1069_cov143-Cylindrotheca_fusiformis.AAC.7
MSVPTRERGKVTSTGKSSNSNSTTINLLYHTSSRRVTNNNIMEPSTTKTKTKALTQDGTNPLLLLRNRRRRRILSSKEREENNSIVTRIKRSRRKYAGRFPWPIGLVLLLLVLLVLATSWRFHPYFHIFQIAPTTTSSNTNHDRWAYVFLLADVDIENPFYRGFLYNIMVSTYVLKHDPTAVTLSKADVVVLVQMAPSSQISKLPEEDLLERMNIQVRYLPSIINKGEKSQTFYTMVLAKFEVLRMTDYTKVLFLDGDVLPLCNLDYLMRLSSEGILQETILHAMYDDPVNAGLFVVTPRLESYHQIQTILDGRRRRKQKQNGRIPSQKDDNDWDPSIGWGGMMNNKNETTTTSLSSSAVVVVAELEYRLWNGRNGSGWDFYCANADQGLLLYWARFIRQNLSIVTGPVIEQYYYSSSSSSTRPTSFISTNTISAYSCLPPISSKMKTRSNTFAENAVNAPAAAYLPIYQDFFHMVGYAKAWNIPPPRSFIPKDKESVISSSEYWYFLLEKVKERFDWEDTIPSVDQLSSTIPPPRLRGDLIFTVDEP